jgi:hypothetical protein
MLVPNALPDAKTKMIFVLIPVSSFIKAYLQIVLEKFWLTPRFVTEHH